jgi:fucose permease
LVHPVTSQEPASAGSVRIGDNVAASLTGARRGFTGFLMSGMLLASLGAFLLAWRYHIQPDFIRIGNYFLFQALGQMIAPVLGARLLRAKGIGWGLWLGCAVSTAGLLLLAFYDPPGLVWGRFAGVFLMGLGAGFINNAVFHAITPAYDLDPAATLTLGGALFNVGCLASVLFVAGTFFVYTVPSILVLMAVAPAFAAAGYARVRFPADPVVQQPTWKQTVRDFKSPSAVLFAALLFFQFGNEGALAGWLAIFLTQKLGVSPTTALTLLGLYWFTLLVGRLMGRWILRRVRHSRLLAAAVLAPMFACSILTFTNNLFGAITGVLFAAGGFSVITPLVVERIEGRFPYFHPGFFNGIFSIAQVGALLAPASLGYFAEGLGIGVVMGLPLLGSIMVLALTALIFLEGRLSGTPEANAARISG